MWKVFDELSIVRRIDQKAVSFIGVVRARPFLNATKFLRIGANAFIAYNMAKKADWRLSECALAWFQLQVSMSEAFKGRVEAAQHLDVVATEDDDVVEVSKACRVEHSGEYYRH